jgi:formylglycine-generating enzyme required for sulfatase activity
VVLASTLAFVGWLSYESISVDDAWPVAKVRLGIDYREPEMVLIEPGEFLMGSPKGEMRGYYEVQHPVKINKPFEVGRYEVTFDQYDLFVKATKRPRQEYKQGFISGSHPVVFVSWNDALAYAQWLSEVSGKDYRLPTEAEWEYVARACPGGLSAPCQGQKYWWGDDLESIYVDGRVAANCGGCGSPYDAKSTAPVDDPAFRPNAFGLYHTAGNVWEWTCSKYSKIYDGAEQGCVDQEAAGDRVLRGGSWDDLPDGVRSANRGRSVPGPRNFDIGFRLARSL